MKRNLWNNWEVVEKIGEGSYAEVYKAYKKVDGIPLYCAVKYIELPKKIKDEKSIIKSTTQIIASLKREITIMQKLNGNKHIINCLNFHQERAENRKGADCYVFIELAEDIEKYFAKLKTPTNEVLQMGIDICEALEVCQDINVIHRDIKPSNIFIGEDGNYKLGDFGSSTALGEEKEEFTGTYNYVAPEIYNQEETDTTSDIYSLGLVMYKLLNNNKLPFVSSKTTEDEAIKQRLSGKKIPKIRGLDPEIMNILTKTCAYKKEDRYKTPTELAEELKKVHFKLTGKKEKPKEKSTLDKTISIQEMKKIEAKEEHSIKRLFNKNKHNKHKRVFKIIFGIIIILIIVFLLLTQCNKDTTCEAGYIKRYNQCVKGYYSCEEGYTLNEDKCEKVIETIDAIPETKCEKGYELEGNLCIKNDTKEAENGYYCQLGYTLNKDRCEREDIRQPVANASCPNGYTFYDNKCISLDYQSATTSYTCPSGYTLANGVCTKSENNSSYLATRTTCPNGGTLTNNQCHQETDATRSWMWPYYSCPSGYEYSYRDNKCHNYYTPTTTNYCTRGTLNGSTCTVTTTATATVEFSCPSGYDLYGNQCAKTSAQAPNVTYTCDTGYTLSDNACRKTLSIPAENGYHCETGYTLSGTECSIYSQVAPTIEYKCRNGYQLRDNKCVKLETTDATPHYEEEKES